MYMKPRETSCHSVAEVVCMTIMVVLMVACATVFAMLLMMSQPIIGAHAQFTYIIAATSATFGQCLEDVDCAIYANVFSPQPASYFICNTNIGRCQTLDGMLVEPAFATTCPFITLSSVSYPSLFPAALPFPAPLDGMIVVNVSRSVPLPSGSAMQGSLRLFAGTISNITSNASVTLPFIQQQFVNTPGILFYFRDLAPGAYTLQYYDMSGCIVTAYPPPITVALDGSYLPFTPGVSADTDPVSLFLRLPTLRRTPASAAFGVGIRAGLVSPWSPAFMHVNASDVGAGQRVPYAHIRDISGGLLETYTANELLWAGPIVAPDNVSYPLGGVTFPLGADAIPMIIATQMEAMMLAGFISVQFGIGFAYRDCANCSLHFIQDYDGIFEGFPCAPIVLDLNTVAFMNATTAGYDVGPMHFRLNGGFTNTRFMYSDSNYFSNVPLMSEEPTITMLQTGTNQTASANSLCLNGTVASIDVYLNYSNYWFVISPMLLLLYEVQMTPAGIQQVSLAPFPPPVIVAQPYVVQIADPGFYCMILQTTLPDGRGPRPLLQSCFQIGVATAGLTQVNSSIVNAGGIHYPYTPFAGYSTNISAAFIVGLPPTLLVYPTIFPEVQLTRHSLDADQQSQIDFFDGSPVDIFNTPFQTVSITKYYNLTVVGPYILYTLIANMYAPNNQFIGSYAAGSSVVDEVGAAKLLLYAVDAPKSRPSARRSARRSSLRRSYGELQSMSPSRIRPPSPSPTPEPASEPDYQNDHGLYSPREWAWPDNEKSAGRRKLAAATASESRSRSRSQSRSHSHSWSQSRSAGQTRSQSHYSHSQSNIPANISIQPSQPAQTQTPTQTPEYYPYYGGGERTPPSVSLQYSCTLPTRVTMIEFMQLVNAIDVQNAICPNQEAAMYGKCSGGFPFAMTNLNYTNPVYRGTYPPTTSSPPFTNPVACYQTWKVVSTSTVILAGVGANFVAVPQNVVIELLSYDSVGSYATTYAVATSIIPPSFMIVTINPQTPTCIGGVQFTQITFTLSNNNPQNIVTIMPTDVTARELYDPNVPTFNLPANCTLLQNYTAYEVYQYCVLGQPVNVSGDCTYCTKLPIPYPQQNGPQSILTMNNNEWWTISVWAITPFWNNITKRFVYCNTQKTVASHVPRPLAMTFTNLQRIAGPPACLTSDCFQMQAVPIIDPCYAPGTGPSNSCYQGFDYTPFFAFASMPVMRPLGGGVWRLTPLTVYNITMFIGSAFCPAHYTFIPSLVGPFIEYVRTTPSNCGAADASVTMYVSYNNPSLAAVGTLAQVCMYWPGRHGPTQTANDAVPIPFVLPVDAPSATMLPTAAFSETQAFTGIGQGIQTVMIYDRCGDGTCTSCLNTATFTLSDPTLRFTYEQFNVTTAADPAGGIMIARDGYQPAQCSGDTYFFNFSFVDNRPVRNGPVQNYEVVLLPPYGNVPLQQWSSCLPGGQQLGPPQPFGQFQNYWGPFLAEIPTGGNYGLGISGNYTFQVLGCTTGCLASYPTFIDMVQPFDIFLSSAGSTCAYTTAQLVPQVWGPPGFGPYDNVTLIHMYPDSDLLIPSPYIYYWKTPLNPNNWTEVFLQLNVIPGLYQLMVEAPGPCFANKSIVVTSPSAFSVTVAGYAGVCQTFNQSTVYLNVSGGTPPYRLVENITSFSSNNTISAQIVAQYNATHCYHVLDSSDCMDPQEVCFSVPDPGPVNMTVVTVDSCMSTATGSVHVSSDQHISCSWSVTGGPQPQIQSCTLVNLPVSAQLVVTATTIIGCTGQRTLQIGARPPIIMTLIQRTTVGVFDGPCVDNITVAISGGSLGPPYLVSLFNDITNATISISYNFNITTNTSTSGVILVQHVCRSYLYTIVAAEHDHSCAVTLVVNDPEFSFGGGVPPTVTLMGLGPPDNSKFQPYNPYYVPYEITGPGWFITIVIAVVFALAISFAIVVMLM